MIKDFISRQEEIQILSFLSTQNWRTDLNRRVIHYGGSYCLLPPRHASAKERQRIENDIVIAEPMPSALDFLISRMIEQRLYLEEEKPEYCIVNEYTDNQGISAHVENFKFGEPVCGLTMGNGDWMRFHELTRPDDGSVRSGKAAKAERTGHKQDVWLPPRSLLVMRRDARSNWQHQICRSWRGRRLNDDWKRISLTFRVGART